MKQFWLHWKQLLCTAFYDHHYVCIRHFNLRRKITETILPKRSTFIFFLVFYSLFLHCFKVQRFLLSAQSYFVVFFSRNLISSPSTTFFLQSVISFLHSYSQGTQKDLICFLLLTILPPMAFSVHSTHSYSSHD